MTRNMIGSFRDTAAFDQAAELFGPSDCRHCLIVENLISQLFISRHFTAQC